MIETVTGLIQTLHGLGSNFSENDYPLKTEDSSNSQENPKMVIKNYNAFGVPILQLLEKLYFTVQCNYALEQQTVQVISEKQARAVPSDSFVTSLDYMCFTFELKRTAYIMYQKCLLNAYSQMANLYS